MRTFVIGEKIELPTIRNKYRLAISFMSGDGDDYATEHWHYDTVDELELVLNVLDAYNRISWNEQCKVNEPQHWYNLGGFEYNWRSGDQSKLTEQQRAFIRFADNIPSDVFSDGDWQAAPSQWAITHFDCNGREHQVIVTNEDGTPFFLSRQG